MSAIQPVITDAGLAAVFAAQNDGLAATISHMAIGDAAYTPTAARTTLGHERLRVPVHSARRADSDRIHLEALFEGTEAFWIREVGFFLEDGTLLAVWSDPSQALGYKSADVAFLLALDLTLAAMPPDSVTVNATGPDVNLYIADHLAVITAAIADQANDHLRLRFQLMDKGVL
ncbi:phage tail protein [Sulfurivirga sp.]|uniref:phage tail-collar fiber domain-containing protein n=1 Tax=Sulfurivirga sp. TaxID=2614236 RepID=UPI0025D404E2|nr:phage tail protein [Sulfurivirga sp.]